MGADASEVRNLAATMRASHATVRKVAGQAVRKGAHDIEARAKSLAPVDTGALRSSISTTMQSELEAEIGPTVAYGPYVEYGTRRMAPQPYMAPAADAAIPGIVSALEQAGAEVL